MTDIEIWRTAVYDGIVYERLYKVSNLGKILSLNYNRTGKPELMNPAEDTYGYFVVTLRKNKEKTTIEWATYEENNNYATRNERIAKAKINGKLSKRVLQLSLDGELIREWPSTRECGRNGFCQVAVWACCNGKKPQYKGFKWEYK